MWNISNDKLLPIVWVKRKAVTFHLIDFLTCAPKYPALFSARTLMRPEGRAPKPARGVDAASPVETFATPVLWHAVQTPFSRGTSAHNCQ